MNFFLLAIGIAVACSGAAVQAQRINRRQVDQCITPDNYYGFCVTLSYCPQVVNIYQTQNRRVVQQYLFAAQRACGTRSVNNDPVICCARPLVPTTPAPNPFLPTTQTPRPTFVQPTTTRNTRNPQTPRPTPEPTTTRRTTRRTMTTTTTTTQRPVTSAAVIDNRAPSCRGPDYREGVCVDITECQELLTELVKRSKDSVFINFLQASKRICGDVGSIICCPSNSGTGTTTAAPVTRQPDTGEIPRRLPTVQEGCGYTANSFKKIVGGEVSKLGAWPWIALIGYDDDLSSSPFKCGGTLVTARHVVTAAHCIRRDLSFVRLGEHDLSTDSEANHVDIRVSKTVAHPKYSRRDGHSDIAMLYLERNVQFTDFIAPICMPTSKELRQKSYVSYSPFVVGWGKTMEGGKSATVLQELQIPVLTNSDCKDKYRKQNRLISEQQFDDAVLCAGVLSGGKDTCQGDSGGPLMMPEPYNANVRYYLIGVVSYGIGCARPDVPGVYTSTQHFMDWIIQQVANTP